MLSGYNYQHYETETIWENLEFMSSELFMSPNTRDQDAD